MHPADQTIFALSSGRAPSAIAVVRISGPRAGEVLRLLAGKLPKPRQAMRAWLRANDQSLVDAAVVLWFLVRQVGAAPFGAGLRAVTWPALVAAVVLAAVTAVCSAWRWRVVARALGAEIGLSVAVGAYYRSLLLNSVLPGGVLGDVHRAVTHGRRGGDVVRGLRAVFRTLRRLLGVAEDATPLGRLPPP